MNSESRQGDGCVKTLPPDGVIEYFEQWLPEPQADVCLAALRDEIDWQSRSIQLFGKRVLQPRLVCFQGDPGVTYRYSGDTHAAGGWHPLVAELRDQLEAAGEYRFNSVLLNLYRDGRDCMGWHADDERELGANPVIASISLGCVRRFVLRSKSDRARRFELQPAHGSLIVMRGALQHHWQHQVPRTRRVDAPRINLTFRRVELPRPERTGRKR